jgi:ParB family transcriptional regulator, chromosome partitioning protein
VSPQEPRCCARDSQHSSTLAGPPARDGSAIYNIKELQLSGKLAYIKLSAMVSGANPRRYFDPKAMEELIEGIKARNGIQQSILVRPFDDGLYQIIAGERRWRAGKIAMGEDYEAPAMIIEADDQEAAASALSENVHRQAMNPAEEAEAAARMLAEFANDRAETARRLGWTPNVLDRRLALMNATDEVRQALIERKIDLGHAELLAAADKSKQDKILAGLFAKTPMPSVSQLKAMLAEVAKPLETACFDKTLCLSCPQNSSLQASFFADSITAGNCTGPDCYNSKTEAVLEEKRLSMVDSWPRVEIMRPGTNYTVIKLKVEGSDGVGDEQEKACRQCKNFGAAISAVPGKEGRVYESYCFDTPCHTRMVARQLKASAKEAAQSAPSATASATPKAADKGKKAGTGKATTKAAATLSSGVIEFRKKLWRKALAVEAVVTPERSLGLLLALAMHHKAGKINSGEAKDSTLATLGATLGSTFSDALEELAKASRETLAKAVLKLSAAAAKDMEISDVVAALKQFNTDLSKHFRIDAEYLELLTKSEMQGIAEEVGLDKAYGDKFKSLFSEKKPDLIKKLLAVQGFEYAVVPKQLHFETPEKA